GDRTMLFAVLNRGALTLWRGEYFFKPAPVAYDKRGALFGLQRVCAWEQITKAPLKSGWDEPFWLFGDERSLFFVTKSGQAYYFDLSKGAKPEMKPLWTDKREPIFLIVS